MKGGTLSFCPEFKTSQMDKIALINKIKNLEGLTADERSALLNLLRTHPKYGLVWENKPEAAEEEMKLKLPVLTEVKERALINDTDTEHYPDHIIIEGDNLHAETILSYTNKEDFNVIYLDPPYNTGNKDFVYNDQYVDREDGYRHSKWLSFMDKRLDICKSLLADDGTIFISIDENEEAQLKLLCDEKFGELNFVTDLIWQSTPGSNTGIGIKTVTEHVLMYAKNKEQEHVNSKPVDDIKKYKYSDTHLAKRGPYVTNKLDRRMTGSHYSESLNYPIEMPDGTLLYPGCSTKKKEHWNWRWSKQKVQWGKENDFIIFDKKKKGWVIYFKQYLNVDNNDMPIERALPYQNLIVEDSISSARGTREVMEMFHEKRFDYPKPLNLIKFLIKMVSKKDSKILDFFAGSGTTMQAVLEVNAEDGGKRTCFLATNNENSICENVTYARNLYVINGYTNSKGEKISGLTHNNLRYYKTDFVPRERTVKNMRALVDAATDMLCIKEGLYREVEGFGPIERLPRFAVRHFAGGQGEDMLIVYDETVVPELVDVLYGMKVSRPVKIYIFSPNRDPYSDEFEDVEEKVELCALPAAIYDAYREVLPPPVERELEAAADEAETEQQKEDAQ